MAARGSLVAGPNRERYAIPAYPVQPIIDVTGAGNACCGGFIVGLVRTGDRRQAGFYGSVSASLALHQFGAVYPLEGVRQEALNRLAWYQGL